MAHEILYEESTKHLVKHDLESFFYVIFWICLMFDGPGGIARSEKLPHFIRSWIYSTDYRDIGMLD